ncbi:complex I subunit 4 family protein [Flavihumibacter petaseus]|uniref:NADH--quinone oxidoreductase subunit M n=1 Tax=Flavihumibacter petaseus NBRC 106054 TaxID=1220578 RepID=A0A0E9MUF5_9BACT|nr:NADH-quinone oxidoreductase subunit M [Flavihumibacter petaseus]GAO41118.1 NADH--quinone oxidoreductase subunit M [Flavihumibacter petaseus NBRC 106054]
MILVIPIIVLLLGGCSCWLSASKRFVVCRWIALVAMLAGLVVFSSLAMTYRGGVNGTAWLIDYRVNWIPAIGISFHIALDGLSLILQLLTYFLGTLAVLCSWTEIRQRTGFYFFNLLATIAGISGVFIAMDLFLFYFFWELMLVPMYFLIAIWGDSNRRYASYKFFIFTQAGGLLMLLAILALYFIHGQQTGAYSFGYFDLLQTTIQPSAARWIMSGFLVAFLVKLPMVPLHNWLPDAHSEAPTAGSLILAGLLLKTGAYGILRFVLTLFPEQAAAIASWAMLMGVIGIIYGALLAFAQTDIKRLIAYTSVSHMGFVLLGIFSFREIALQGVVMQMLAHGISTGALFLLAGMLKERLHTREINKMGGLWTLMPAMGGAAMLFTMASLGLPMLGNFIAEFLVLLGTFQVNSTLTTIASIGLVLAAVYSLRMMQSVFLGPLAISGTYRDLSLREWVIIAVLSCSIVVLGLYPQPVMDLVKAALNNIIHHSSGGI